MRVSHIHVQQTLLMLNNKKSSDIIEQEIESRCNGMISQISIFNSTFDKHILPKFNDGIQLIIIRKSKIMPSRAIQIFGINLKTVELLYCQLKQLPIIHSQCLQKLNVSNNHISQIFSIPYKQLKLLDLRNNKITRITRQIHCQNITVLHQFITKKNEASLLSLPICLYPLIIEIQSIIRQRIKVWSNSELIETCEQIIQNCNEVLLNQLLPYLSEEFVKKIFQIAKIKSKHSIIQLLIDESGLKLSNQEALELLMPQFIQEDYLFTSNFNNIIKILSKYNHDKPRVMHFLEYLNHSQKNRCFFIQTQKDLINFMSSNLNFPNNYEADFIMTQLSFFKEYDFSNKTILHYLLQFDSLKLLRNLLELPMFRQKLFAFGFYKRIMKPNKKIYKLLLKEDKVYQKLLKCRTDLYFPQYRERKSFCLKNDLYDYEILSQYEQMQCSYSHKDMKFTLRFCNKQNEFSIAKRIQTHLKRKNVKNMQIRKSNYSTCSSNIQS